MSEEKKWVLGLKRAISFIICLIILFTYPTKLMAAQEPPEEAELFAKAAVLMDGGSGRVLYSKNGSEALANASTTKILTCIIALENCDLEQIAEVSVQAAKAPKVHLGAPAGQKFRMKDLIYAMMLESFNDCAVVIAEQVAGTTEHFSKMMNDYAKKIGCADTFFITPNGLDAQKDSQFHHTTAEDLAQIMRYCIKESPKADQFLKITGEAEYTFTDVSGKYAYHCYNHNAFLKMMDGAVSGKTGFTGNAGYCYVGALEQNGKHILWHCWHVAGRTIKLINGRIRESLWNTDLPLTNAAIWTILHWMRADLHRFPLKMHRAAGSENRCT